MGLVAGSPRNMEICAMDLMVKQFCVISRCRLLMGLGASGQSQQEALGAARRAARPCLASDSAGAESRLQALRHVQALSRRSQSRGPQPWL